MTRIGNIPAYFPRDLGGTVTRGRTEAQRAAAVITQRGELEQTRIEALGLRDAARNLENALEASTGAAEFTNRTSRVERAISTFSYAFSRLFSGEAEEATLSGLRDDLQAQVSSAVSGDGPRYTTSFGLEFAFEDQQLATRFDDHARLQFRTAYRANQASVEGFFVGSAASSTDGLLPRLKARLEKAAEEASSRLGSKGLIVNRIA